MKLIRIFRNRVANLYFLCFVNGFLICLYINFKVADDYENRIFSSIANHITLKTANLPEDSVLMEMVHATHYLLGTRAKFFETNKFDPAYSTTDIYSSLTADLMTTSGACGSYSKVMARLANHLGFESRIGQMQVKGMYGGHIIPEIKMSKGWVVVDPMYDLSFRNSAGEAAGFNEISKNWAYYVKQVPANYNHDYQYDGIRYTNWDKIPVVMPLIKKAFAFTAGEEAANTFSLRVPLLPIYRVYSVILLFLIIPISFYLITRVIYRRRVSFYQGFNWGTAKIPVMARTSIKNKKMKK